MDCWWLWVGVIVVVSVDKLSCLNGVVDVLVWCWDLLCGN